MEHGGGVALLYIMLDKACMYKNTIWFNTTRWELDGTGHWTNEILSHGHHYTGTIVEQG